MNENAKQVSGLDAGFAPASKRKVVLLAVAIVVIALGITFGVFQAISAGIESAAPKAAGYLAPEAQGSGDAPRPTPPPSPQIPRAPGL